LPHGLFPFVDTLGSAGLRLARPFSSLCSVSPSLSFLPMRTRFSPRPASPTRFFVNLYFSLFSSSGVSPLVVIFQWVFFFFFFELFSCLTFSLPPVSGKSSGKTPVFAHPPLLSFLCPFSVCARSRKNTLSFIVLSLRTLNVPFAD